MKQLNPADVAAKWSQRLSAATQAVKDGINAVTVSPTVTAAGRLDQYLAGVNAAVSSGRMAAKLQAVSLQSWQQAAITKGVPRIAPGATAAIPKMTAFMSKWLPYEAQLQGVLAGLPRGTLDQNIARAVAAINHNAAFKGS